MKNWLTLRRKTDGVEILVHVQNIDIFTNTDPVTIWFNGDSSPVPVPVEESFNDIKKQLDSIEG